MGYHNGQLAGVLSELLRSWQGRRQEQVRSFVAAYRAANDGATPGAAEVARGVEPPLPVVLAAYYLDACPV
jgi:hypothetical protein